jgi:hypothetical protein
MHRSGSALIIKSLPADGGGKPSIMIEGDAQSLFFLADLIIAQALDTVDCGIGIEAERTSYFQVQTEFGLYIHKLPCAHKKMDH